MRLIDADALEDKVANLYTEGKEATEGDKVINNVIDIIDNAPTVEERPQSKWGKWVISEIWCPDCFEYFQTDCYSTEELKKCPNCGADMRGGNT